jgi:hypothetical protein
MNWRDSTAFRLGYLPLRFLFALIGYGAGAIVWVAAYLMWFNSRDAKVATKGIF